jgi:hypothetical protein
MLDDSMVNSAPRGASREGMPSILRKMFSFPVFMIAVLSASGAAATLLDKAPIMAGKLFAEGDTWWHIVIGEHILATHSWPTQDIFSFTSRGTKWIAHEWLGELIMALAARLGGLRGLALLDVILAITFVLLMFYYAWLRCQHPLAGAVATVMVTPVAASSLGLRPQVLGYIYLLATLIILERYKQGREKSLWLLPIVFLLWVNTHGTFILGFFAIGLYWFGGLVSFRWGTLVAERRPTAHQRLMLIVFLTTLLTSVVTPYGADLLVNPFKFVLSQPYMSEAFTDWQPLDFSTSYGRLLILFILVMVLGQVIIPVDHQVESMTLLMAATIVSLMHTRFVIFFALAYVPVLATFLSPHLPTYKPDKDHPIANAMLVAAVAWGLIAFFPSGPKLRQTLKETLPVDAVEYLRSHDAQGRTFNENAWAGFLMWSFGGHRPVFLDGRVEIYEQTGALFDYIQIAGARPDALSLLNFYHVTTCLLRNGTPLGGLLARTPGWKKVYSDNLGVIFARVGPESDTSAEK